jgi:hypothetical protein
MDRCVGGHKDAAIDGIHTPEHKPGFVNVG